MFSTTQFSYLYLGLNEVVTLLGFPKEDICWLKMFSVAQKRNIYLQKMVPVVDKYMLNWLKTSCVAQKLCDVVRKLKMVSVNVTNFGLNGAPYPYDIFQRCKTFEIIDL